MVVIFGLRLLVTPVKREEHAERPEGLAEELAGFWKFVERHRRDDEHLTFFYGLDLPWRFLCESENFLLFIVEDTAYLVVQGSL